MGQAHVPPADIRTVNEPSPVKRFFGGLMMTAGGLIAVTCGLCTGFFEVMTLAQDARNGDWVVPLIIGVAPTLVGIGLFLGGRSLFRSANEPSPGTRDADAP